MVYGTLTDREIIDRANEGELISEEFDVSRVRQACYELRASSTYYDLATPDRPQTIDMNESILLKPKQMLVLITMESLRLDSSMLGRVLSKGQLFSLGLIPVNTYADPGFTGRLGIVMINASNDYLAIPIGTPIAKIEFVALDKPVERPYSGQHGYETEIWPIQTKFKLTAEEIRRDKRIGSIVEEVERSYGPGLGSVIKRVFAYERKILLWSAIYFALLIGIIALNFQQEQRLGLWVSAGLGVVANVFFLTLTLAATSIKGRAIRSSFGKRPTR